MEKPSKVWTCCFSMINDDSGNTERKIEKESEELHLRIYAKQGRPINMKKELS